MKIEPAHVADKIKWGDGGQGEGAIFRRHGPRRKVKFSDTAKIMHCAGQKTIASPVHRNKIQ